MFAISAVYLCILFLAKVLDNALGTAKTILVQRNKPVLAGAALALSAYISYCITKSIITADNNAAMLVVSIASGAGCCLAVTASNKLSRERTYVNVILSDNKEAMREFRDFLAAHHITNVATDSYTKDWTEKTISITAYPETKAESVLIANYIDDSPLKFKRLVRKS